MAGPYQNFPPSFGTFPPYYPTSQPGPPIVQSTGYFGGNQQFSTPVLDPLTTSFPDFEETNRNVLPAQGGPRTRKRVGAGGEHVKFRRTRSGCYTCRNRRVKCDEARPVCERCRKGNRECVYPEPSSSTKSRRGSTKSKSANDGDVSSQDDGDLDDLLLEEDESPKTSFAEPSSATSTKAGSPEQRAASDPPALMQGNSPTPSTEGSASLGRPQTTTPVLHPGGGVIKHRSLSNRKFSDLPRDIRFYLHYARTKLTKHHWGVKTDSQNFLSKTLIEVALRFDPLLYAVVGFAAYHYTLSKPDGQLRDFLGYYQKSVGLLRQTFKQKPTIATILTILQLATIEEFLGDWVNLMGHQKAAFSLITQMYTPQTINANESLRKILQWYIRYDTYVGILSGSGTQLGREWFDAHHKFFIQQCHEYPEELCWKYEERFAWIRITGFDLSRLLAGKARNSISEEEYSQRIQIFHQQVASLYDNIHPALKDPSKLIESFPITRSYDPDDICDPYKPNLLYGGDIFDTNILLHDLYGFELLFKNQIGTLEGRFDAVGMREIASKMCQIYEAIEYYPDSSAGITIGMQAGLALSLLFLRQDDREIMWARKKLASIEAQGYTYPVSLRTRLEGLWGVDLSEWWLPNEEGCPPIVRQIRNFITMNPSDEKGEDLRDMKGIFTALSLSDTSSPESGHNNSPAAHEITVLPQRGPSKVQMTSAHSDDGNFDLDIMSAHDRALVYGESPEFEWS